ncbi:DUF4241 domain-containing protein [Streptomyces sp. SID4919]|nr:DUF4241 domain-containing protein [Streptomyces sp. SID4919]
MVEVAMVRVPSGRLIVDSPWPEDGDPELRAPVGRELAERIPAGAYRMEAAWTVAPYEYRDERFDGRAVAAVRLRVADAPVVGWEMALGTGRTSGRSGWGTGSGSTPRPTWGVWPTPVPGRC